MSPVAVVVPVLDEERVIDVLAAALLKLEAHAEVVVADGGSRDRTAPGLRAHGLTVIDAPTGRARQMNAGARATSAPVLLFLHADTQLPDDALERASAAIEHGAVGGCFSLRIDSRDPRLKLAARIITWRSRLWASASGDQAIFVARDAFERLGGFADVPLCEDLDLVARLAALGRFECLDRPCAVTSARRWESRGVLRTIGLMWALRLGYHLGVDPRTLHRLYGGEAR